MNSASAIILQFPAPTAESLAAEYLAAKRDAEAAEARMKAIAPRLTAALQASGKKAVSVTGAGRVQLIETAPGARLDQKAAVALLQQHELDVPMAVTSGGTSFRASID
jgi:hypothetical protein